MLVKQESGRFRIYPANIEPKPEIHENLNAVKATHPRFNVKVNQRASLIPILDKYSETHKDELNPKSKSVNKKNTFKSWIYKIAPSTLKGQAEHHMVIGPPTETEHTLNVIKVKLFNF